MPIVIGNNQVGGHIVLQINSPQASHDLLPLLIALLQPNPSAPLPLQPSPNPDLN